ncbi:MAG: type I glyceraldehyde-3-phosphate dehydrogenase [Planctomycetes bacterium]|nr:type I glyceraldehyde-3-phosphate dehydrogenase [Planctomycetota bacterium]
MGRLFLRAAHLRGLDVVCANEPKGTPETLALGIEFDSVHGRFPHVVQGATGQLLIGERSVVLRQEADPAKLPWSDLGIDLLVECSGKAKKRESVDVHLQGGARHVLVSNPVPGAVNLVVGVNDTAVDFARTPVATAASCTTNCLAPIVRVLHDALGIVRGVVTTIHDPTNTQGVVDRADADPRRGRSALLNLIPTTTNSATAVTEIVPELAGRLDSIAVRAPVLNASLTDCAFQVARPTTVAEVNAALQAASVSGRLRGILGYETRPLVSSDFAGDPRSAVVDALCTRVVDGSLVKVMAWYDNEWGYVNRMADLAERFAAALA